MIRNTTVTRCHEKIRVTSHGNFLQATRVWDIASGGSISVQSREGETFEALVLDKWNNPTGAPLGRKTVKAPRRIFPPSHGTDDWSIQMPPGAVAATSTSAVILHRKYTLEDKQPHIHGVGSVSIMTAAPGHLITGHEDGTVRLWSIQSKACQQVIYRGKAAAMRPVTALAQSQGWLVWAYGNGEVLAQCEGSAAPIVVSAAAATAAAAAGAGDGSRNSVSALAFPSLVPGHPTVVVSGSSSGVLRAFVLDSSAAAAGAAGTTETKMQIDLAPLIMAEVAASSAYKVVASVLATLAVGKLWLAVDSSGLLGSDQPVRVFALCTMTPSSTGAAAAAVPPRPAVVSLSAWDLNAGDCVETRVVYAAASLPVATNGANPMGLQWHNGRLFSAMESGTVQLYAPDLTVQRDVCVRPDLNLRSMPSPLTGFLAMDSRRIVISQANGDFSTHDLMRVVQERGPTGRWRLDGVITNAAAGEKYTYETQDVATEQPNGAPGSCLKLRSSGILNDGATPFVCSGTMLVRGYLGCKAEWVTVMAHTPPVLVSADVLTLHNIPQPDGKPSSGPEGNMMVGRWEMVSLDRLSTPQLGFYYESHVGLAIATAAFTPHSIHVTVPQAAGTASTGTTSAARVCQRVLISDLNYPSQALCDICNNLIPPTDAFFHEGALDTVGFDVCVACARQHAEVGAQEKAVLVALCEAEIDLAKVPVPLPAGTFEKRRMEQRPDGSWGVIAPAAASDTWQAGQVAHRCLTPAPVGTGDGASFFSVEDGPTQRCRVHAWAPPPPSSSPSLPKPQVGSGGAAFPFKPPGAGAFG